MRRSRDDPAHFETLVDNCAFNALDTDRLLIDSGNAGTLTRCGTDLYSFNISETIFPAYTYQVLTLPVNSGNGFVMSSLSKAAFH